MMKKHLIKTVIILGAILALLAVTGGTDLVYSVLAAPSTGLATTLLSQSSNLDTVSSVYGYRQGYSQNIQAAAFYLYDTTNLGEHAYCHYCHGSMSTIYTSMANGESDQAITVQLQIGLTIECAGCHIQRPVQSLGHFGGDD